MKNCKELLSENCAWAEETFRKIDNKMKEVTKRPRAPFEPRGWTSGFWGAMNVLLYERTKNADYLKSAKENEQKLDEALADFKALYHDVGFQWHILSGALYRLTGDEKSKNRNLHAASSLFSRFVLGGNYIRAWNDPSATSWQKHPTTTWTIIDCMMNLPILYFASDLIGDDRFKRIAMAHADNTLASHIRPDGSVIHVADHDRETGEVTETFAGQGYADGSSWSRGQAWAVYGFVLSYIHTKEQRYLDAAKRVANYFIACCCDDWIPRIDFRAPSEPVYYDTTAGCCAACGLIEIAKALPEHEGGVYMHAAIKILRAISEKFGDFKPETDGMILGGSARYPIPGVYTVENSGVHMHIIYADFFFTEAILKLLGSEFNPW